MLSFFRFSMQQALCVSRRYPSTFFGDADGHDLILAFVDGFENRCGREQRNFMLSASSAKQDADSNLFHCVRESSCQTPTMPAPLPDPQSDCVRRLRDSLQRSRSLTS